MKPQPSDLVVTLVAGVFIVAVTLAAASIARWLVAEVWP